MELIGREVSVGDVLAEVLEDRPFYALSGGGITLSGGEPLAQVDFAVALLRAARKEGLHCCVETSGHTTWDRFQRLLPVVDLFLYDYKETDPERHRLYTGQTNEAILKNLHSLHDSGAQIQLNCPVIPGFNDRNDHLAGIAALVKSMPRLRAVRLLPYHPLGTGKLKRLGLPPLPSAPGKRNDETIERWLRVLREQGVPALN
jgi:pyruvate formate lyase activating enzyme